MSIVSVIKDSVEVLNNTYDSVSGELTIFQLIQEIFIYTVLTIKNSIFYFLSFQWIRDFTLLPVIIPQISNSIFQENFFLEKPFSMVFSFLEIPAYSKDKLFIGFLNSFFLTLPITTSHIIAIRNLLVKGSLAGINSFSGIVFGQWVFIVSIIFGLRPILIPWLSIEPLSYFLGVFLILKALYSMIHEPVVPLFLETSNKKELASFFLFHFCLAFCEQTCIFQYVGNISASADPTSLETFYSKNTLESFLIHSNYALGLLLGCCLFTGLFVFVLLKLRDFFNLTSDLKKTMRKRIQFFCLTCSMAFTLSSIPFYGFDYLFTGPLGFVSQDQIFQKTILAQTNLKDTMNLLGYSSNYKTLDTDIAPFDRGKYIVPNLDPIAEDQTFEDLNYRGEYHWTRRQDTLSSIHSGQFKKWSEKFLGPRKKEQKPVQFKEDFSENLFKNAENSQYMDSVSKLGSRVEDSYLYENETSLSTFLKFTKQSFSTSFFQQMNPNSEKHLEKEIKQKYYANPVYKFLLNRDIDFFINRQPKSFLLDSTHEKDLVKKRLMLANYYDTLRDYSQISNNEAFENFFNGSKSYADRVYNQQFKGTLRVVRRLFSLSLDETENPNLHSVLKFDQPLYKFDSLSSYHEELQKPNLENSIGLQTNYPIPFYAGWDTQTRKFVLTNRMLPSFLGTSNFSPNTNFIKKKSLFQANNYPEGVGVQGFSKAESHGELNKVIFTAWPLSKEFLEKPKSKSTIPYSTLFESFSDATPDTVQNFFISPNIEPGSATGLKEFTTLPPNLKIVTREKVGELLAPQRESFVWPGNSKLKFAVELKKFPPTISKNF